MMDECNELKLAAKFAACKLGNAGGCHDFDHTLRVLANAESLLKELPDADAFCVKMAVYLHDIARPLEDDSGGAVCHAEKGAELAGEYLKTRPVPGPLAEKICQAVLRHRYRGSIYPRTLEEKIVFDADKLDSIGAAGVGRAFLFAGKCGARLHNTSEEALSSQPYSVQDTAYREYLVKLRKISDVMQTLPGRKFAGKRSVFMKAFFDELSDETGLK